MLYQQIESNKRKTIMLILLFCLLIVGVGIAVSYLTSGDIVTGIIMTLVILAIYVPTTYMSASKQVLSMSGARKVSRSEYPQLHRIVEEVIAGTRLPKPDVYVVNDPVPNAFATGINPDKAAVAFTTGLLEQLNREELEGVAAHEVAHIQNYDIRVMTISIALVGVIVYIGNIGTRMLFYGGRRRGDRQGHPALMLLAIIFIIFSPLAAQFIRLAISRNREYLADATAVNIIRNPHGLIRALEKISSHSGRVKNATSATAAMYISMPLGKRRRRSNLFSTHPPVESRIKRLQEMTGIQSDDDEQDSP
ncbi:MAG TPA: zinc metalloprotease HtpX [Bacillota bacterium]|nr:zinc metalloprotease HtpX [Bacillota bacterium]